MRPPWRSLCPDEITLIDELPSFRHRLLSCNDLRPSNTQITGICTDI